MISLMIASVVSREKKRGEEKGTQLVSGGPTTKMEKKRGRSSFLVGQPLRCGGFLGSAKRVEGAL